MTPEDHATQLLLAAGTRRSERAAEILRLVAVGDGPLRDESSTLPEWARYWPEERGNALPTDLAIAVAAVPATHVAALSPGERRAIAEAEIDDLGWCYSETPSCTLPYHPPLPLAQRCGDRWRPTRLGEAVYRLCVEWLERRR